MSDDITQKLRVTMPDFKGLEISCPCRIRSSLMKDAADEIEKLTRERDEARAEVERLRETLKIAAGYVECCYHTWYQPRDLAEALRDLTKIREVLNDERAGELEVKP